jgi:phosphoglycolate phosphatase-like HAD superfamily hydrolase
MKPLLALDFDGVISDSLLEAYLITWRISGRLDPTLAPADFSLPLCGTIHSFRSSHQAHWQAFSVLVPFGNRAEDYLVIQKAVCLGLSFASQEEFTAFRDTFGRSLLERFHELFYVERYQLADSERDRWLALNDAYPGVKQALRELSGRFELAVATSKDRETVVSLLIDWDLFDLFGAERVLDKRAGESKREHLSLLREHFGCAFNRITFIDDKLTHLLDCAGLGVRPYLAGWGYNGPQEHALATRHSIPVLKLENLSSLPVP